ncbi:MAG: hypothetical protein V2J65_38365 [Desulfobacteraceae bacterium]|jgi:hypothetical protein|nr:hypothetical protein [Desulfobacteraceae bacterium]
MKKWLLSLCVFLSTAAFSVAAMADLTGKWAFDDGGTYYLRQSGNRLV